MSILEKRIATLKNDELLRNEESRNKIREIIGDTFFQDINQAIERVLENSKIPITRDEFGYYRINFKTHARIKNISWKDTYHYFGDHMKKKTSYSMCESFVEYKNDDFVITRFEMSGLSKMCNPMSMLNTFELALWAATFPLYGAYKMLEYNKHYANGYIPVEIALSFREKTDKVPLYLTN
jgi:hypothetical protein